MSEMIEIVWRDPPPKVPTSVWGKQLAPLRERPGKWAKTLQGARKRAEEIEKARNAFLRVLAGRAEVAYKRGDQVFQYDHNVMSQQAIVIKMVGAKTSQVTSLIKQEPRPGRSRLLFPDNRGDRERLRPKE
jgi:hypothetical protein